jgi:hypothetical protein
MTSNNDDQKRYADLVETCARAIAFTDLNDVALPQVVVEMEIEAAELAGGWTDFDPDRPRGTQDLPIVDAVTDEIFARANELRLGLFGIRRKPPPLRH